MENGCKQEIENGMLGVRQSCPYGNMYEQKNCPLHKDLVLS